MPNLRITADLADKRLDRLLAEQIPSRTRSQWQELIKNGQVVVNQQTRDSSYRCLRRDLIKFPEIELPALNPSPKPLEIIYQNDDLIVVNKPAGLITHPNNFSDSDSLVQRVIHQFPEIRDCLYDPDTMISQLRPGIVHRLDKETSGVMVVARNIPSLHFLSNEIRNHQLKKTYLALLWGQVSESVFSVDQPLGRSIQDRGKIAPRADGRASLTEFKLINLFQNQSKDYLSLVEARPVTGRTHQIRVHASYLNHPVMGDNRYGNHDSQNTSRRLGLNRQFLHASSLTLRLPGKRGSETFKASLPEDLNNVLERLNRCTI